MCCCWFIIFEGQFYSILHDRGGFAEVSKKNERNSCNKRERRAVYPRETDGSLDLGDLVAINSCF